VLIEGLPGLGKTHLAIGLANILGLPLARIQCTPDLMPGDVTGSEILIETSGTRRLEFRRGPIFANMVLVDEINRATPKTQSALLEAMQERRVTYAGVRHPLPDPFWVLATQNPIELEGTYPLPEAQLDRFMFEVIIDHLPEDQELAVVTSTTGVERQPPDRVIPREELIAFQKLVRRVPVSEPVARYALAIVRASRPGQNGKREFVQNWVAYGASSTISRPGREGPRADAGTVRGDLRRRPSSGTSRAETPDPHEFPGPVGGHYHGSGGGPAPGIRPRAEVGDVESIGT
jgi:MoxR-like ATPase